MRNDSLWSNRVFEKEVIFHKFDFETSVSEFEVLKSSIWMHTTSFIIIWQLRWPIEVKFSQVCYFMHVEIHQVRRLVFDNIYQLQCPVLMNYINFVFYPHTPIMLTLYHGHSFTRVRFEPTTFVIPFFSTELG